MEKLDLVKKYKQYYTAKTKPEIVEVGRVAFLTILGKGDPSEKQFSDNIEALYSAAYTIKFASKDNGQDFVVAKLEGLWWFDESKYKGVGMEEAPKVIPRKEWKYRLMIRMPDFVTEARVKDAIIIVMAKRCLKLAYEIELYYMEEGKSVQMLHVGPFDKEPETLKQIRDFTKSQNLKKNGLHHEIYLSDFRKTVPDKLKTILREPVK